MLVSQDNVLLVQRVGNSARRDGGETPQPVLSDFGHSHMTSSSPELGPAGKSAGTTRWMAPELVWSGSPADEKTDVFAFGMLIYVCPDVYLPIEKTENQILDVGDTDAEYPVRLYTSDPGNSGSL